MSKSISKSFAFQASLTFGTNVIRFFLGIIASVIVARILGPRNRGIYALALLLPSFVVTLGNLGIASGTVYYVAKKEFSLREVLLGNLFWWLVVSFVGITVELLLIFFFRGDLVPGVSYNLLLLTIPLIPLEIFLAFFSAILLGKKEFGFYNLIQFLQTLFFLLLVILILIVLRKGLVGAIGSVEMSWFLAGIVLFCILWKREKSNNHNASLSPYLKKTLSFGVKSHLSNVLGFLNYRIDQFLLNFFAGATALGFYSIAVGLGEKLWMLSQSVGTVLFPTVASDEDKRGLTPVVARMVFIITGIAAILLGLLAAPVIKLLYSTEYADAIPMLQMLLPGIAILSASRVLANDIAGRGYPIVNTYRGIVTVITNVVLNILWIPRLGGVGAALASTISYTVSFLLAVIFYNKIANVSLKEIVLPGEFDVIIWKNFFLRLWNRFKKLR